MSVSIPLREDQYYHLYNRGNGGAPIFYKEENYPFFLRQYDKFLADYLDTYAYCLLPDHFHLLVRVKSKYDFPARKDFPTFRDLESLTAGEIVSELLRRFAMSYSKTINGQQSRAGGLLEKAWRRKEAGEEDTLTELVYHLHAQPQQHGLAPAGDWSYPWSSYPQLLIEKKTKLCKKDVLRWFGGMEAFVDYHAFPPVQAAGQPWEIETP